MYECTFFYTFSFFFLLNNEWIFFITYIALVVLKVVFLNILYLLWYLYYKNINERFFLTWIIYAVNIKWKALWQNLCSKMMLKRKIYLTLIYLLKYEIIEDFSFNNRFNMSENIIMFWTIYCLYFQNALVLCKKNYFTCIISVLYCISFFSFIKLL